MHRAHSAAVVVSLAAAPLLACGQPGVRTGAGSGSRAGSNATGKTTITWNLSR